MPLTEMHTKILLPTKAGTPSAQQSAQLSPRHGRHLGRCCQSGAKQPDLTRFSDVQVSTTDGTSLEGEMRNDTKFNGTEKLKKKVTELFLIIFKRRFTSSSLSVMIMNFIVQGIYLSQTYPPFAKWSVAKLAGFGGVIPL